MEDWHDIVSLAGYSLAVGLGVSLIICVPIYLAVRGFHSLPRFQKDHTWKSDLKPITIGAGILFALFFVPSLLVGNLFSDMCGTGDATEIPSPDGKHKIVVYNFDCGATTDFSFDVSLLRARQKLPIHKTAELLYSHYHQRPEPGGDRKNFEVIWTNSQHAVVKIDPLDGEAKTKNQDGVEVQFQQLLR